MCLHNTHLNVPYGESVHMKSQSVFNGVFLSLSVTLLYIVPAWLYWGYYMLNHGFLHKKSSISPSNWPWTDLLTQA